MTKTAVIFTHEPNEGPGSLGDVLQAHGVVQKIIYTPQQNLDGFDALSPDLLMIMGGPMGVYEADRYPYLTQEIEIIKQRIAANHPVLGVCLGAQLMAKALGANVYKGANGYEYGWHDLAFTSAAYDHPTQHLTPEKTSMFHDHGDTFDLPVGARLLASSAQYKSQIYAYGENALGLQCHPEVTMEQLEDWPIYYPRDFSDVDKAQKTADIKADHLKHRATLKRQTSIFFKAWLSDIGLL